MKFNKNAYLFAAALVAGTMGMTSCSNEMDDMTSQWEGKTTNAKIGFSLSSLPGTRSSSDDVNMGNKISNIKNVAVVPMIGETPTTPIKFGDITGLSNGNMLTQPQTRALQSTVNRFLVYGNMPADIYAKLSETATPKWAEIQFTPATNGKLNYGGEEQVDVYQPHGLYYYRDTKVAAPGKTAKGYYTGTGEWGSVVWADSPTENAIGDAQNIKISDVRYAVGVLATAVFQKDETNKVFFRTSETEEGLTFGTYQTNYSTAPLKVSGIVIGDQAKTLKYDFTADATLVPVYDTDEQNTGALATAKLSEEQKTGANFYTVAAPSVKDKGIGINIEFTVAEGATMKLAGDKTYNAGDKIYVQAILAPQKAGKSVFAAATSTMLNATVTDWGKATEKPEKPTDTNVGVEFDASWIQGTIYDVEI